MSLGRGGAVARQKVEKHESVALHYLASRHVDKAGEHRAVPDEAVELAVLAARID